jgi:hypothetical protein
MIGTPENDVSGRDPGHGDEELQNDGEELLNFLVPIAFQRIGADGTFAPFGAVVLTEGGVEPVEAVGPADTETAPDEVFTQILETIRSDAEQGRFRTAGLCADVHVVREDEDDHTDAIRIYLERRDGEAMDVFLPYSPGADGEIEKGQIFAVEAEARLFFKDDGEGAQA